MADGRWCAPQASAMASTTSPSRCVSSSRRGTNRRSRASRNTSRRASSMGRVIAAGLVAGLVLNVGEAVLHGVIFAAQAAEAMKQLGHDIAGSGAGTTAGVGLILWALSAGYSAVYLGAGFAGLIPRGLVWGPVAYELV